MARLLKQAILLNFWLTILLGLIYPGVMTALAQALFPRQANGSLTVVNGKTVGSALIGQSFSGPKWFHPRPSAAGKGYDATSSGGSNLGPTSKALMDRVDKDVAAARKAYGIAGPVPADMATASASGLDPDISPENALAQVNAVAKARGLDGAKVRSLVESRAEGRQWGFLGEPRVNVLKLNLSLQEQEGR